MPQAAETAEAPAGASAPKAAVRLAGDRCAGSGGDAGRNRPAGCDYAERIVVHRNGNLLAVQFQRDATGFIF